MQQRTRLENQRVGLTILEVIVVVTIIGILIALLLPAVQSVRLAARKAQSLNQMRQISLGFQSLIAIDEGRVLSSPQFMSYGGGDVFARLMPVVEGSYIFAPRPERALVLQFYGYSDPSYNAFPNRQGNCSYGVNSLVCRRSPLPLAVTDGSSTTIAFGERYAVCGKQDVIWSLGSSICKEGEARRIVPCGDGARRATFVDQMHTDVMPVVNPPFETTTTVPGFTFQLAPSPFNCDPRGLQSSYSSGLIVALLDGSVRTVGGNIKPALYWAAITPDGGEVMGDW